MDKPLEGHRFRVDLGASVTGYFAECQGLPPDYQPTGKGWEATQVKPATRKIPGRTEWRFLSLKRGVISGTGSKKWVELAYARHHAKAWPTLTITLLNDDGLEIANWAISNVLRSKIVEIHPLPDGSGYSVEEFTLAFLEVGEVQPKILADL